MPASTCTATHVVLVLVMVLIASRATVIQVASQASQYALAANVTIPEVTNATAVVECLVAISYRLCSSDVICRRHFDLTVYPSEEPRKQVFQHHLRVYLYLPVTGVITEEALAWPIAERKHLLSATWILGTLASAGDPLLLETDGLLGSHCAGISTPDNRTLWENSTAREAVMGQAWWLSSLRMVTFCTENEIFDEVLGCVCQSKKICDEVDAGSFSHSTWPLVILFVVAFGIMSCWCSSQVAGINGVTADMEITGSAANYMARVFLARKVVSNPTAAPLPSSLQPLSDTTPTRPTGKSSTQLTAGSKPSEHQASSKSSTKQSSSRTTSQQQTSKRDSVEDPLMRDYT